MQPRRELTLDDRLRAYLAAPDSAADAALDALFAKGIRPVGRAILRAKLHISLRPDDDSHLNQVGLDMFSDVVVDLLATVKKLRTVEPVQHIASFHAYVATAFLNSYRQYLRAKYPERLSLRNKVRYILLKRPRFDLWIGARDERICGLKRWRGEERAPLSTGEVLAIKEEFDEHHSPATPDDPRTLIELVDTLVDRAGAPVRFEDLVSLVWLITGAAESTLVTEHEIRLAGIHSAEPDAAAQYDAEETLRRLWQAVKMIPLSHRRALLLNLTDGRGENLIVFLPRLRIASIREIAAVLDYDPLEFASLWAELPLDDMTIADMLGITRQQVINLRQTARAKLRRIGR